MPMKLLALIVACAILGAAHASIEMPSTDAILGSIEYKEFTCANHTVQGDTVYCYTLIYSNQWEHICPGWQNRSDILIWPFKNGTQWGAKTQMWRTTELFHCEAWIAIPMPEVGVFEVLFSLLHEQLPAPSIGLPLPASGYSTKPIRIEVKPLTEAQKKHRYISAKATAEDQTVMFWEPWFTPECRGPGSWELAEAIPMVGTYSSWDIVGSSSTAIANRNVLKQHCLWWAMAGVTAIGVDWTNNVWSVPSFDDRKPCPQTIFNATLRTMETLAAFKEEGIPVPQFVLLTGLDNGPTSKASVLNAEIEYITSTYLNNPKLSPLMMRLDGKPLLVVFDGSNEHGTVSLPAAAPYTLRYMSSQFQSNKLNRKGFFSWMDGSIKPEPTPDPTNPNGRPEALTITNAFFAQGGWLAKEAWPQDNGATLLLETDYAQKINPKILFVCQWNEFFGSPNGAKSYGDIYNASFSNDMEPTSLTSCGNVKREDDAWWACGGWGMRNLNLLRAAALRRIDPNRESLQIAFKQPHKWISTNGAFNVQIAVSGKCTNITRIEVVVGVASLYNFTITDSPAPGEQLILNHTMGVGNGFYVATAYAGDVPCKSDAPIVADQVVQLMPGNATARVEIVVQ